MLMIQEHGNHAFGNNYWQDPFLELQGLIRAKDLSAQTYYFGGAYVPQTLNT